MIPCLFVDIYYMMDFIRVLITIQNLYFIGDCNITHTQKHGDLFKKDGALCGNKLYNYIHSTLLAGSLCPQWKAQPLIDTHYVLVDWLLRFLKFEMWYPKTLVKLNNSRLALLLDQEDFCFCKIQLIFEISCETFTHITLFVLEINYWAEYGMDLIMWRSFCKIVFWNTTSHLYLVLHLSLPWQ